MMMPITQTLSLIFYIVLYALTKALSKNPGFSKPFRIFFKVLSIFLLVLAIIIGVIAAMRWYVYLVERFIEPYARSRGLI